MNEIGDVSRSVGKQAKPLRWVSAFLFAAALAGIAAMLLSDATRHYAYDASHQHIAAFPLMLIGLSYISLQLSAKRSLWDLVKGILLGLAFVLWGGEQLMPPSAWVTAMDSAVVTIFVVDLGLMIGEHLRRSDRQLP